MNNFKNKRKDKEHKSQNTHSFDIDDAAMCREKIGPTAVINAILLYDIRYWLEAHIRDEKHIYDGRVWMYRTIDSFYERYKSYLTKKQVTYALTTLQSAGVLLTGNYNKLKYDKSKWYSINETRYEVTRSENDEQEEDIDNLELDSQDRVMEYTSAENDVTQGDTSINSHLGVNGQQTDIRQRESHIRQRVLEHTSACPGTSVSRTTILNASPIAKENASSAILCENEADYTVFDKFDKIYVKGSKDAMLDFILETDADAPKLLFEFMRHWSADDMDIFTYITYANLHIWKLPHRAIKFLKLKILDTIYEICLSDEPSAADKEAFKQYLPDRIKFKKWYKTFVIPAKHSAALWLALPSADFVNSLTKKQRDKLKDKIQSSLEAVELRVKHGEDKDVLDTTTKFFKSKKYKVSYSDFGIPEYKLKNKRINI